MNPQTKNDYITAGKIAAQSLAYGASLIKKGSLFLDVTQKIEQKIFELGGRPAFPAQVSCNQIAAHFCPEIDDKNVFDEQLVCLDIGVQVNGAIGDTACTIDLSGKYADMVSAARTALDEAIKIIEVGVALKDVGKVISETIASYGYRPVRNLSGHGLGIYDVHTAPTIPNYDNGDSTQIEEGMVFAVEPFATNGVGMISEAGIATVFSQIKKKPVRGQITRDVLREIETYHGLPFASRWLMQKFGAKTNFALRELLQLGVIKDYPPLVEVGKGMVAQAEHSVMIEGGTAVVLTRV